LRWVGGWGLGHVFTSKATALIDATVTAQLQVCMCLSGVKEVGQLISGARMRIFYGWGGRRDGLIGGCSAGGRRACGARRATDSGV
jgi:hypothetical protein